jgi:hypothetical protein
MAEPVTIGGQTFIKTGDGWVDQKSKAKAPEGLLSLLNRLQVENSPEGKKKRVRIDTSRPIVKLGKTEYVWDLNSNVWIDKKTKDAANPAFSKLIEAAYQGIVQGKTEEEKLYESWAKKAAAGQVFSGMGVAGQAAKQRVRTPTGGGQLPAPNIKINSPIVQMIEKLATVDGYLKQRLDNQKKIAANNNAMIREASIEAAGQLDAEPVIDEEKIKEEAEKENEKSNGAILAVAAIAAGALVSQLEPVKEAFSSMIDFAKGIYGYFKDFTNVTNTALESINSMFGDSPTKENNNKSSAGAGTAASPDASPTSPSDSASSSTPAAPSSSNQPSTPSSSTPTATTASNSRSTIPATTPLSSSGSTRVNTAASPSNNNSGTRSSAPSPTRSTSSAPPTPNATPAAAPTNTRTATPAPQQSSTARDGVTTPQAAANTDATKTSTNVIAVNHPETGNGFGIAGANDSNGRPIAFSKEGAEAFAQMMQDSNGAVKPSDVASSKRSPSKNAEVGGATNSPHLRGVAMDIHGTSGAWIRQHGHRYNWRPHDYSGTHGGHFVFGGNGMVPDEGSSSIFQQVVSAGVDLTKGAMEAIGTIAQAAFGKQKATTGSQLLGFNDTMSGNIDKAAREKTAAMVDSKTPESTTAAIPAPISMSAAPSPSSMQGIQTESDKSNIEWYLTRMGFAKANYEQTAHV